MAAGSTSSLPPTGLLYFVDSSLLETSARRLAVRPTGRSSVQSGEPIYAVVLDRTIFHPQGGGQPSDTGFLVFADFLRFRVEKAVLERESGVVFHEGTFCTSAGACSNTCSSSSSSAKEVCGLKAADIVRMKVDEGTRKLHSRLHSAGHVLDVVEARMHLKWLPGKGYHFPDGPYLEYSLGEKSFQVNAENKESLLSEMQRVCDDFVSHGCAVDISLDYSVAAEKANAAADGTTTQSETAEDSAAKRTTARSTALENGTLNVNEEIDRHAQSSNSSNRRTDHLSGSLATPGDAIAGPKSANATTAAAAATSPSPQKHQQLPTKDTRRFVSMAGVGTFCGGTHVKDVKDIGRVKLTKIVCKKKAVRISYTVEDFMPS